MFSTTSNQYHLLCLPTYAKHCKLVSITVIHVNAEHFHHAVVIYSIVSLKLSERINILYLFNTCTNLYDI
jgi:hypothetical protein